MKHFIELIKEKYKYLRFKFWYYDGEVYLAIALVFTVFVLGLVVS